MGRIRVLFRMLKKMCLKALKGSLNYAIGEGLKCGKGCVISSGTDFGSEPYLITLHDNVRISSNVSLITHDGSVHTIRSNEKYKNKIIHAYGKIEIDDNTFIGANVTILPNVYIGKNCIIGTGSIVTHSIPDNSVVAGIPARVIGNTWDLAEKKVKQMPQNWDNAKFQENMQQYLVDLLPAPPRPQ